MEQCAKSENKKIEKKTMKKLVKSITAVMLIAVIAIGVFHMDTVYAAKKTPPLKITFNGKSLNLIKVTSSVENYLYSWFGTGTGSGYSSARKRKMEAGFQQDKSAE